MKQNAHKYKMKETAIFSQHDDLMLGCESNLQQPQYHTTADCLVRSRVRE
jgi:hypothetical protein